MPLILGHGGRVIVDCLHLYDFANRAGEEFLRFFSDKLIKNAASDEVIEFVQDRNTNGIEFSLEGMVTGSYVENRFGHDVEVITKAGLEAVAFASSACGRKRKPSPARSASRMWRNVS